MDEPRGRQFRVYWRNPRVPGLPARSYAAIDSRDGAERFISMASVQGLHQA